MTVSAGFVGASQRSEQACSLLSGQGLEHTALTARRCSTSTSLRTMRR